MRAQRVLQTLQLSDIFGGSPRTSFLVPRTPVLVRVLQTLQMSIHGGIPPVRTSRLHVRAHSQGHPFSRAYFKQSKCPRSRPTPVLVRVPTSNVHRRQRPLVPRTPVLARVLANSPSVHSRRHHAHVASVPRTPVLARVLQTVQMSIPGGSLCTYTRPKDTRARARTSNTPNFRFQAAYAHVHSSHGAPCSCANFKHPEP